MGVSPKLVKSKKRRKKKEKKEEEKKVGENNGQLRFIRHHVWRTQACLDQYITHATHLTWYRQTGLMKFLPFVLLMKIFLFTIHKNPSIVAIVLCVPIVSGVLS